MEREAIEEIFKTNPDANFFLDEMPYDDFKPDSNGTSSIVSLANILRHDKFLWAACRNQSTAVHHELQGIKFENCWVFFRTKLLYTSI